MTIFGWDASHYDGTLTTATLTKAAAEGIAFFTHKIGQGLDNTDTTAGTALAAAKSAGVKVIGGYYFLEDGDDPIAQAKRCIALADQYEPWWRTFPGWFWQTDAERDADGVLPTPMHVKAFSDALAAQSGRTVVVYASHGMYGDRLAGIGHPLWNANYPSSRQGVFANLYPGDSYTGWTAYSGQTPVICQYTSSATIAGLTTCDANAFRGTIGDLLTLIGADVPLTATDAQLVVDTLLNAKNAPRLLAAIFNTDGQVPNYSWMPDAGTNKTIKPASLIADAGTEAHNANVQATSANAALAGLVKQMTALTALVQAGGGDTDVAAIVKAVGDAETAIVTELKSENTALATQVAALQAKLIAAEQAAAAAIAK